MQQTQPNKSSHNARVTRLIASASAVAFLFALPAPDASALRFEPVSMTDTSSMEQSIKVSAADVTLGALFANTPDDLRDTAVMAAPAPGETITLSAYQMKKIAMQYDIAYEMDYLAPLVVLERIAPIADAQPVAANAEPLMVSVNTAPVVAGRHVTLGDIFAGYFSDTEVVIADAPAPGGFLVIPMSDVRQMAMLHGLSLKPVEGATQIRVKRRGTRVSNQDIEKLIATAIAEFGFQAFGSLSIEMADTKPLFIPVTDSINDVYVSGFRLTAPTRFAADLILPSGGTAPRSIEISGAFKPSGTTATTARRTAATQKVEEITPKLFLPTVGTQQSVLVKGNAVWLTDLFTGMPADMEDTEILKAPAPGMTTTLSGQMLTRIAEEAGLSLDLPAHIDKISIHRDGIRITSTDYRDLLKASLSLEGIGNDFEVELNSARSSVYLPVDRSIKDIFVESLDVAISRDRFTAVLSVPTGDFQPQTVRLSGRLIETREIPVFRRSVAPGDIIDESNISWTRVPLTKVTERVANDPNQMIGLTVKRAVGAGTLIKSSNLERPLAIKRGTPVLMSLQTGPMTLTTTVKAMTDGSVGDLIRVENMSSGQLVDARIVSEGRVEAVVVNTLVASLKQTAGPGSR